MPPITKSKGPRAQRYFILFFSIILGILVLWLLNFMTRDIATLPGPQFAPIRAKHVDPQLESTETSLRQERDITSQNKQGQQEQQNILKDSTDNLQNTINQLLAIQRKSIERNVEIPADTLQTLAESQTVFLENQHRYQEYSRAIADLTSQERQLEAQIRLVSEDIRQQENQASQEHRELSRKHRLMVAALKLAVVVPILLIAAGVLAKKRTGPYAPLVYAVFIAVFVKLSLIVHEHFPTKYFKYIALAVIMVIVIRILVFLIKRIISPKLEWLLKQYQEAYDKCLCPICTKPIRVGPMRYGVWRKRKGLPLAVKDPNTYKPEAYTCPSCGSALYENCNACSGIRHALLPFCEHCGDEKSNA